MSSDLADRLAAVRERMPRGVQLLAVSKGQPAAAVRQAVAHGQRSFGESRLQEAMAKQAELADLEPLDWHFIGRLQANKARGVVRCFGTIHSLDSLALAERLQRIAAEEGRSPALFAQVKLRSDPTKTGFSADELRALRDRLGAMAPLRLVGMMTIPPLGLAAADRCRLYREAAALAASLELPQLSMGMSDDWPEAVAAGATWVRLGTGLFGPRLALPPAP
jgi:pyridoxal phosphate enzyme (YggS family)